MEQRFRRSNIKEVEIGYFIIPRQNVQQCFFSIHLNPKHSQAQPKHLHAMATETAQREEKVNNVTRKIIGMEK